MQNLSQAPSSSPYTSMIIPPAHCKAACQTQAGPNRQQLQGQGMSSSYGASTVLVLRVGPASFAIYVKTPHILTKTALLGETSKWSTQCPKCLPPPVMLSYYTTACGSSSEAHQQRAQLSGSQRHTWAGRWTGNSKKTAPRSSPTPQEPQYSL